MLIGKYYYKLEASGRLSLPKKFRKKNHQWILSKGLDGCLFLHQNEQFETEINRIAQRSFTKKNTRDLTRYLTNDAHEVNVDKVGRLKIPQHLIDYADLKKDIVIVGSYSRIEIWDQKKYHNYLDELDSKAENIAENIELET